MRRVLRLAAFLAALLPAACAEQDGRTRLDLQRFFGECSAVYGASTDVAAAEGECGIVTTLINRFQAENPDIKVNVNVVAWPGYAQLTAQTAAGDPPDLVTMHQSVIPDYQGRGLLAPMDEVLRQGGVDPATFTAAGRRGVTKGGKAYGLPWDTVGGLAHVNTALFAKAGLMRNGEAVLPQSTEELFAHAKQFRERTGLPYLIQSTVNDPATHTRNFYTYMMAQDAVMFPEARRMHLRTPEARRVVELFRRIEREGVSTKNQDDPAAMASFFNGEGGMFLTGTWRIGGFEAEAKTPGRPLYGSYAVYPYPRLLGHPAAYVDGHAWVMPKRRRTPEQQRAIARFLGFMANHNFDWSRTGHLPAFQPIVDSAEFKALPHRADIAPLATIGSPLPEHVRRQGAIEGIVGEEVGTAVAGTKSVDQALGDAEKRVNDLLEKLP
jgi:multiple sugar transport system substrate-binding protein